MLMSPHIVYWKYSSLSPHSQLCCRPSHSESHWTSRSYHPTRTRSTGKPWCGHRWQGRVRWTCGEPWTSTRWRGAMRDTIVRMLRPSARPSRSSVITRARTEMVASAHTILLGFSSVSSSSSSSSTSSWPSSPAMPACRSQHLECLGKCTVGQVACPAMTEHKAFASSSAADDLANQCFVANTI